MPRVIALLLLVSALVACQTRYIHLDKVRYQEHLNLAYQRDSIYLHDSLYIEQRGDTLYRNLYRIRYREVKSIDTVYLHRVDSIAYPIVLPSKPTLLQRIESYCSRILGLTALIYLLIQIFHKLWRK